MEYTGKLYAKISNKYLETSHTYEFEKLEQEFRELKSDKIKVEVERDELLSVVQDLQHERNIAEAELTELKEKHQVHTLGVINRLGVIKEWLEPNPVIDIKSAKKAIERAEQYYNETHKTK